MGMGQYHVTVCIIQSFQKLFIFPFVKFPSPYQDSHMQIIGANPDLIITTPLPDTASGICKIFFLQVYNCYVVRQAKCDIDNEALWSKPVKGTAASGNVDQSKPDSHFDSQIDPYISCILIYSTRQHKC